MLLFGGCGYGDLRVSLLVFCYRYRFDHRSFGGGWVALDVYLGAMEVISRDGGERVRSFYT